MKWWSAALAALVLALGAAPAAAQSRADTAAVLLKTARGRICQISNSRRATYGYDQRIEVHGSKGRRCRRKPAPGFHRDCQRRGLYKTASARFFS